MKSVHNIDQNPVYPASLPYDNIITVANLIFNGKLDRSSNFGPASVDIAAPGTFILSTIPDKSYAFMSGTSMAAPMVAGAAAMPLLCPAGTEPAGCEEYPHYLGP